MQVTKNVAETSTQVNEEQIIRESAKRYSENEKVEYFNLAESVSTIYEKGLWQGWGFSSFEDYGEKELKRAYRTMRNLSVVGDMIRRTGLPIEDTVKIDKSVLSNIASYAEAEHLDKAGIQQLIDEVENLSFEQAKEVIKARRIKDAPIVKIVKLQLKFTEEQYAALEPIIKEAQDTFNTGDNISLAIEYALMVWGSTRIPEQDTAIRKSIEDRGLNKPIEKGSLKRKEPAHKGKRKITF